MRATSVAETAMFWVASLCSTSYVGHMGNSTFQRLRSWQAEKMYIYCRGDGLVLSLDQCCFLLQRQCTSIIVKKASFYSQSNTALCCRDNVGHSSWKRPRSILFLLLSLFLYSLHISPFASNFAPLCNSSSPYFCLHSIFLSLN